MKNFFCDIESVITLIIHKIKKIIKNQGYMLFLNEETFFQCYEVSLSKNIRYIHNKELLRFSSSKDAEHIFFPLINNQADFIKTSIYDENIPDEKQFSLLKSRPEIENAIAIPLRYDSECLGFFIYLKFKEKNPEKKIKKIQKKIRSLLPILKKALYFNSFERIKNNLKSQKEKLFEFSRVIKKLNQLQTKPYYTLLKEILNLFPFDLAYLLLKEKNKLKITEGYTSKKEYINSYKRLYNYFIKEKNMPEPLNQCDMALSTAFLTQKSYYIKDVQSDMPYETETDIDNLPIREKDKVAIKLIQERIYTILHIPIIDGEESVGVLELFSFNNNIVELDNEDIQMIENIASFIPLLLRNLSLYDRLAKMNIFLRNRHRQFLDELKLAKNIQQQLIPRVIPEIKNMEIAAFYKPMENLGGDLYDFIKVREPNIFGFFISDVSGHGVPAALIMSMIKSLLETSGENRIDSNLLLMYINEKISGNTGGNFLTAFYGLYNAETKKFKYSRAGHNYPLILRGNEIIELKGKGRILGIMNNLTFETNEIDLEQGDKVLLYTDGLTEATNPQGNEFEKYLPEVMRKNKDQEINNFIEKIYHELLNFKENYIFEDDVCMVGLNIK